MLRRLMFFPGALLILCTMMAVNLAAAYAAIVTTVLVTTVVGLAGICWLADACFGRPGRRWLAQRRVRAEVLAPPVTAVVTSTRRPPALPR
jgi:hypothetical protein